MASKTKKTIFHITGRVMMETSVEVAADTMEDALVEARKLKVLDFVTPHGDHLDSDLELKGIWTP